MVSVKTGCDCARVSYNRHILRKSVAVCMFFSPSVQVSRSHFCIASTTDLTYSLIPTLERFLHAFQPTLPFLIITVMLKLLEATLHTDSALRRPRRLIKPPFQCSNSECPIVSALRS